MEEMRALHFLCFGEKGKGQLEFWSEQLACADGQCHYEGEPRGKNGMRQPDINLELRKARSLLLTRTSMPCVCSCQSECSRAQGGRWKVMGEPSDALRCRQDWVYTRWEELVQSEDYEGRGAWLDFSPSFAPMASYNFHSQHSYNYNEFLNHYLLMSFSLDC